MPVSQAAILIAHLIKRLQPGESRLTLAKLVIDAADPLWFGDEVLRWLYVTDDADRAEKNTLTKDEVEKVGKALVERIKARATAGEPLFNVDVSQEQSLLYAWRLVEGRDPVQSHLSSVFANDPKNIVLFLQSMVPQAWSLEDGTPQLGRLDGRQLSKIGLIFDLDALAQMIRQHLPGNFQNAESFPSYSDHIEQRLAEQFMFAYDNWKRESEPPETHEGGDDEPNET